MPDYAAISARHSEEPNLYAALFGVAAAVGVGIRPLLAASDAEVAGVCSVSISVCCGQSCARGRGWRRWRV